MRNFSAKLFLTVFVGTLGLGFSAQAQAENLYVNWLYSRGVDCISACGKTGLKFAIPTGIDRETYKKSKNLKDSLIFICTTHQPRKKEWRPGFNKAGENSCTTTFDGVEFRGTDYFCLCTNRGNFKPFTGD